MNITDLKLDDEARELVLRLGHKLEALSEAQEVSCICAHFELAIAGGSVYFSAHPMHTYLVSPPEEEKR